MKKKKRKLREKIRNKPKSRNHPKKKFTSHTERPEAGSHNQKTLDQGDQGMEPMSNVILDFAQPLLETCSDESSEKKAISLAIFVWNSSLLPERERKQTLDSYLSAYRQAMPKENFQTLCNYIDRLVQDKMTRFAHNRNKITNCTFGESGERRRIEVGYTLS